MNLAQKQSLEYIHKREAMEIKTVKLDIDGVIRDPHTALRNWYIKDYPQHRDLLEPVTAWGIHQFYPIGKGIYDYWFRVRAKECFEDAPIFDGAYEFVLGLKSFNKVILTTSQPHGIEHYTVNWLKKHQIPYDGLVFIEDKTLIRGDVLLDDGEHNLIAERITGKCRPIAFDQPWNVGWVGERVKTYSQFLEIL